MSDLSFWIAERMPLASMMQQHQKLLQIMSNIKFNCTSEMISQIISSFYRLSQAPEDVMVSRHTKLEYVSSCMTKTATCHWVQSPRAESHLGQNISPRPRNTLQRSSARSGNSSASQDDSFFPRNRSRLRHARAIAFPLPVLRIVILGIVIG